ncbi:MAG: hypothetical protein IJP71_02390 [Lachnospiraceae bacterium]|nr:hypothetical protein [Lachnospiraceae bacterium]
MTALKEKVSKYKLISWIIIATGILLRLLFIGRFPVGLNCDEASTSYDAYAILNTLCDRNGNILPVYPLAWGSGQSALYMYLSIPFIKLLGLNIFATRLPMVIISSISLIVFYKMLNLIDIDKRNKFFNVFALLFFVLNPWHIMKSRWGLDCNILPDMVLFSIYFILKFIYEKKEKHFYIGFILLAVSAYSYIVAVPGITLFCILLYIYGIKNKIISFKNIFITFAIVLLIDWPLILFVIINIFKLGDINLPFLSISMLRVNRMSEESIIANSNIFYSIFNNILSTLKLLVIQVDPCYWNRVIGSGIYYLFSFPILIVGIISFAIRKKSMADVVFMMWLISSIVIVCMIKDVNINHLNYMIIPLIYFVLKGFEIFFCKKTLTVVSFIVLLVGFGFFAYKYVNLNILKENNILIKNINTIDYDCFNDELEEPILYADTLDASEIHMFGVSAEPYIYVLYYTKADPKLYIETKELINEEEAYNNVKVFDKWVFEWEMSSDMIEEDANIAYILPRELGQYFDNSDFNIKYFKKYVVLQYNS